MHYSPKTVPSAASSTVPHTEDLETEAESTAHADAPQLQAWRAEARHQRELPQFELSIRPIPLLGGFGSSLPF